MSKRVVHWNYSFSFHFKILFAFFWSQLSAGRAGDVWWARDVAKFLIEKVHAKEMNAAAEKLKIGVMRFDHDNFSNEK